MEGKSFSWRVRSFTFTYLFYYFAELHESDFEFFFLPVAAYLRSLWASVTGRKGHSWNIKGLTETNKH